nr:TolC family protein [uncultured Flavobacterium sp.]
MKQMPKYIALPLLAIVAASCATPKVADLKLAKEMPVLSATDSTKQEFQAFELRSYFTDPNLLALFDQALEANPDYLIAQQRIDIANSFLKRSKLNKLPSLEIGVTASGNHYGDYTIDGVGNYDTNLSTNITDKQRVNRNFTPNYWLGVQSSWEADIWGKLKNQSLAAQKRFLASQEGMRMLKVDLFTNISILYYELITLDNHLKIYEENYQLEKRALEIVSAQRTVGKATELAVQQIEAQNKNIQAEIEHLKVEIITVEKAIRTLIGSYDSEIARGTDLLASNRSVLNSEVNVNEVIHNRPDVKSDFLNLEASRADAKAAKAAFYPSLNLGGSIGYNAFSAETWLNPKSLATQLLGGLMVPVFNKGQLKQEFAVANAEQEITFLNYQKTVTSAFNELQAILKQIDIYERVLSIKQDEIYHLDRAVEVSNDLYVTGYANYLELINTRKTKLQAELDFLRFQKENTKNNILLFKALGGLVD